MSENKNMGMYIHIPFCSQKCDYCDFISYSMDEVAQKKYLQALFLEIERTRTRFVDKTFDTLYIGGGTPSIMYDGFILELSRKLFSSFHFAPDTEFTIEVNPSSFTREKFFEYVQAGMNRISVGVQCLDEKLLKEQGRIQSIEDIDKTFEILSLSKFDNVSGDIMIGLPKQDFESIEETVCYLIDRNVKHISTYALQVEKHTMLYEKVARRKVKLPNEDKVCRMYDVVGEILTNEGYKHYEISNFAKPGYESRHNQKYWQEVDYLGLGVSAHSYVDGYRFYNTKRLDTYIDNLEQGKAPIYAKEYIDKETRKSERIMLSLRTKKGLDLTKYKNDFGEDLLQTKKEKIGFMIDKGMIKIEKGFIKVSEANTYIANAIIRELM